MASALEKEFTASLMQKKWLKSIGKFIVKNKNSDTLKLFLLMLLGACLLLPNLGDRLYWGDEREDFNFIWRILEYGVPYMKDGHTDGSPQVNENHLHVYHPWLYLYSHAAMVKIFGWENRLMFRLPGVLWALVSIAAVWRLSRFFGQSGNWATLLYTLSPFVLVPARLSRYYGAVLGLSPLVILAYLHVAQNKRGSPWFLALWLTLLFHHNTMAAGALGVGCLLHWLLTGRKNFRGYLLAALVSSLPIFGWIFGMGMHQGEGRWFDMSLLPSYSLKGFWILLASIWPLPLCGWLWWQRKRFSSFNLLCICLILPLFIMTSSSLWVTPTPRYFLPVVCLAFCAMGFLLESLSKFKSGLLCLLLVGTNFFNLVPLGLIHLFPLEKFAAYGRSAEDAIRFFKATSSPRYLLAGHLAEIGREYESPGRTLQIMLDQAGYSRGETIAVIIPEGREPYPYMRAVTQATFDIYQGLPGEMILPIFVESDQADWIFVCEREVPEKFKKYEVAAVGYNQIGFWSEGPNPFNRRWKTSRQNSFFLLKKDK